MDRHAQSVALEKEYVHDVYDHIAPHFSNTHFKAWPKVRQFLEELPLGAVVADIGCGNGRYIGINTNSFMIGCDCCAALIDIAKQHESQGQSEVMVCDNLQLPYRDACFDGIISIGVIHHFSTIERRIKALSEIARLLRPGGKVMIYVWALEQKQRKFEAQDVLVPYHMQARHIKKKERRVLMMERELSSASSVSEDDMYMEISLPRTPSTPKSVSSSPGGRQINGGSYFNWDSIDNDISQFNKSRSTLNLLNDTTSISNGTSHKLETFKTADVNKDLQTRTSGLHRKAAGENKGLSDEMLSCLKPKPEQMFKLPKLPDTKGQLPIVKSHFIRSPKLTMRKQCLYSQGSSLSSMEDEDVEDEMSSVGQTGNIINADHSKRKTFRKHVQSQKKHTKEPHSLTGKTNKQSKHESPTPGDEDTDSDSAFSNISRFLKSRFPSIFSNSKSKSSPEKPKEPLCNKDNIYKDLISQITCDLPIESTFSVVDGFEVREFPQSSRKETFNSSNQSQCGNGSDDSQANLREHPVANGSGIADWLNDTNLVSNGIDSNGVKVNGNQEGIQKNGFRSKEADDVSTSQLDSDLGKSDLKSAFTEKFHQFSRTLSGEGGSSFSQEFIEMYMQYVDISDTDILQAAESNRTKSYDLKQPCLVRQLKESHESSQFKEQPQNNDIESQQFRSRSSSAPEKGSPIKRKQSFASSGNLASQNGDHSHVISDDMSSISANHKQYQRYYHVFRKKELVQLIENHIPSLRISQSCYDHANWCVVAEKV